MKIVLLACAVALTCGRAAEAGELRVPKAETLMDGAKDMQNTPATGQKTGTNPIALGAGVGGAIGAGLFLGLAALGCQGEGCALMAYVQAGAVGGGIGAGIGAAVGAVIGARGRTNPLRRSSVTPLLIRQHGVARGLFVTIRSGAPTQ